MSIARDELLRCCTVRFGRGGGPGGQHVNKVSTLVELLLDFETCSALSDWQRSRIRTRLRNRLTRDNQLRVVAQSERSQAMNRAHAEQRLLELLEGAFTVPKARTATRPTRASRERRLDQKRQRGQRKQQRRWRSTGD